VSRAKTARSRRHSLAGGEDLSKVVLDRILQLLVGAGVWIPVRPPAEELGRMPESISLHVLVPDLDYQLRPERNE